MVFILSVIMLAFSGCFGGSFVLDTPDRVFLAAEMEFTEMLSRYKYYYELEKDLAEKEKMAEIMSPIFIKGNNVLDTWKFLLNSELPTDVPYNDWLNWKSEALLLLNNLKR